MEELKNFWWSCKMRFYCLEETWQRGYSFDYRMGRLKEALYPLLGEPWKE